MSIVPSKIATLGRQARVIVTPFPATLAESSAVLKALQRFGTVSTFLNPRYVTGVKEETHGDAFLAIFDREDGCERAVQASPIAVDVGHDELDPVLDDPFMVRDLAGRKNVERKTFSCKVVMDEDPQVHSRIVRASPYYASFVIDRMTAPFQDLTKQGIPLPEMADAFQKKRVNLAAHHSEAEKQKSMNLVRVVPVREVGLMDMWRNAVSDGNHVYSDKSNNSAKKIWRKLPPFEKQRLRQARGR